MSYYSNLWSSFDRLYMKLIRNSTCKMCSWLRLQLLIYIRTIRLVCWPSNCFPSPWFNLLYVIYFLRLWEHVAFDWFTLFGIPFCLTNFWSLYLKVWKLCYWPHKQHVRHFLNWPQSLALLLSIAPAPWQAKRSIDRHQQLGQARQAPRGWPWKSRYCQHKCLN